MNNISILNRSTGTKIADRIDCAETMLSRMVGLLGRKNLDAGGGIWIQPSSGVHTIGMQFAIDVVGLDAGMRVVRLWPKVKPNRVTSISPRVRSIIELAAGEIHTRSIRVGDVLQVIPIAASTADARVDGAVTH